MDAAAAALMTIGALSRRTGVPVKQLRTYEDLGLLYTIGRSAGNYRLFGDEALWCVRVVETLRGLGLTLAEIQEMAGVYLRPSADPFGPRLAAALQAAKERTRVRIGELNERLARIAAFEAAFAAELAGEADFRRHDPLDSPTGGRA